ncbi:uncharacterized protein Dwil_GK27857 [Drosophila willistoni]|uniref:Uncharacterized protein n=1 Tax=Drosophila willistoni TaxID=7260 RepID=A0A0Q9WQ62_DROWI|nr:uncharacterized protein Dwil_GK27857 [Drosophila willistoni]
MKQLSQVATVPHMKTAVKHNNADRQVNVLIPVTRTTEETTLGTETTFGTAQSIETTSPSSLTEQTTLGVSKTMPTSGVPLEGSTFPSTARIPTAASTFVPRTTEETTLGTEPDNRLPFYANKRSSFSTHYYPIDCQNPYCCINSCNKNYCREPDNRLPFYANKRSSFSTHYYPIDCQNPYCCINSCNKNYCREPDNRLPYYANKRSSVRTHYYPIDCQNPYCCINSCIKNYCREYIRDGVYLWHKPDNRLPYYANKRSSFRTHYYPIDCQNPYCCINSCIKNYCREYIRDGVYLWHKPDNRLPYYANNRSSFRTHYYPIDCQNPYCCINSSNKNYCREPDNRLSYHAKKWSSFRRLYFPIDCQNPYCWINSYHTRNGDYLWYKSPYRDNFSQFFDRTDNLCSILYHANKWSSFRRLYFPIDCQNPYCCNNSYNRFSYHANKRSCFRSNYFPIDCQNPYCCINSCIKNYCREYIRDGVYLWHKSPFRNNFS